jgi:pentatricopeptide repeat protein
MWARAECTGTILTNATGTCEARLCYFVGVLNACANVGALEEGRCTHEQIIQSGYESVTFVGNSLVDMSTKCGSMEDAWRVFNKMPSHNVVTLNAMVLVLGQ